MIAIWQQAEKKTFKHICERHPHEKWNRICSNSCACVCTLFFISWGQHFYDVLGADGNMNDWLASELAQHDKNRPTHHERKRGMNGMGNERDRILINNLNGI